MITGQWRPIEQAPKDRAIFASGHDFGQKDRARHFVIVEWDEFAWVEKYKGPFGHTEWKYLDLFLDVEIPEIPK